MKRLIVIAMACVGFGACTMLSNAMDNTSYYQDRIDRAVAAAEK